MCQNLPFNYLRLNGRGGTSAALQLKAVKRLQFALSSLQYYQPYRRDTQISSELIQIKVFFSAPPVFPKTSLLCRLLNQSCSMFNGFSNSMIGTTAADIVAHSFINVIIVGIGIRLQEFDGG